MVLRVHALADPITEQATEVTVVFDEPVEAMTAQDRFNYHIDDGAVLVSGAVLLANLKTVVLSTDPIATGSGFHTLTVESVADRSPAQNQIISVTKQFRVTHLVAHYGFDDASNRGADSAAGNDGMLVGGPTAVTGKIGAALSFDDVHDYVLVSNSPSFGVTGDITLAAWVKRADLSLYGAIIAKTDGANAWDFDFYFDDGPSLLTFYSDATSPQSVRSTNEVPDTEWHHVAMTRSGSTITFYIDALNAGASTISGDFANNPLSLRIATDGPAWDSKSMFHGSIDDVRFYNRALSDAEIQALVAGPGLRIVRSGNTVAIFWPTAAVDFVLQRADNLAAPNWTTVTDQPMVVGNENTLSFSIGTGARFYRLKE